MSDPLPPRLVDDLRHPGAYPSDAQAERGVEWIQTHLSHVFLTPHLVVKLRKAVDLGFVDFSTRGADCVREVELNRRLAPDVYFGVAPVVRPVAEAIHSEADEVVVAMRRLPDVGSFGRRARLPQLESIALPATPRVAGVTALRDRERRSLLAKPARKDR